MIQKRYKDSTKLFLLFKDEIYPNFFNVEIYYV